MQVWYSVPHRNHQRFLAWLTEQLGPQAVGLCAIKTLLPLLPADVVREFEVQRIVQQPGELILTAPVSTVHNSEVGRGRSVSCSCNGCCKRTQTWCELCCFWVTASLAATMIWTKFTAQKLLAGVTQRLACNAQAVCIGDFGINMRCGKLIAGLDLPLYPFPGEQPCRVH